MLAAVVSLVAAAVASSTLVAIAAVVTAPLVAYVTASRRLSGKIGTSEAADLWAESKAMRDDYRDRADAAAKRIAELEGRVAKLEGELAECVRRSSALQSIVDGHERLARDRGQL